VTRVFGTESWRDEAWGLPSRQPEDWSLPTFAGAEPLRHTGLANGRQSRARDLKTRSQNPDYSKAPKSRNHEIPKDLFSRPLTFVLDVILVDLEPLFTKGDQNLVPDRDAGFRVAEA
jgi:hypothetical protein